MKLATAEQMRALDRQAIEERGIPSIELMERAAEGVAAAARALLPEKPSRCRLAVFCGSGNNGGDGLAAARLLFLSGAAVRVFLAGSYEKLTPDALEETRRLSECGVELEPFDPEDTDQRRWVMNCHGVIDALLGVGLSRAVGEDSPYGAAIRLINECPAAVVSADIPSGISADSGQVLGMAVRADRTVTFTLPKIGHFAGAGGTYTGELTVWPIGIPEDLPCVCAAQTTELELAREALPRRKPDGHKGDFGKLLIVGGAVGYTGAPYLTASAAVRTGCGLVYLGVPECIWPVEAVKCVSAMPFPLPDQEGKLSGAALALAMEKLSGCDVLALGPGLGRGPGPEEVARELLRRTEKAVVLDADGINALAGHMDVLDARRGRVTVLTPHDGEFARLTGRAVSEVSQGDRVAMARQFAADHGCVLVLKGRRTVIAGPEGNVLVNTTGNSGLAKGGSGDVLTGVIASLLCQGATVMQAAACGVWLHGRAGDLAAAERTEYGMTPEDAAACLPAAIRELTD
ncbi:NAD(P)H-hydrate dehydratase [Dysosmobacter sp.]|uniref:NAD(P)H-hydrate dehydratase n=1 Tax=Dysosmobacter sp. TaxID=2591382 RepID=UPI002A8DE010|nr:NAD(P)H-hydrate dehydratase [Dysosmobacter sp.]MDY3282903.1 NAD(P)H-hydrate dehydratase [Dysosmobacter sp.]